MKKEANTFKKILKSSKKILILTHKGPDFDAFCSALILKEFINTHYPKKEVTFKARQSPTQNIPHMHEVQIVDTLEMGDEDLIILTDAGNWDMCVTHRDNISQSDAKLVIIDHHDTQSDESDLSINNNMSSATEQVLSLCMDMEGKKFKISEDISILGQIGIISDTGRFLYENATPDTYVMMSKLRRVKDFDIEDFTYKNSKFPFETLTPLRIYLANINMQGDMAYTYITKEEMDEVGATKSAVNNAQQHVRDNIIRHIQGMHWGFVVKPSYYKENIWQVSFRSTKGYQKVDKIAEALGGGGHEYSSAARVEANQAQEAVQIVLDTVKDFVSQE